MKCLYCGANNDEHGSYCKHCGNEQAATVVESEERFADDDSDLLRFVGKRKNYYARKWRKMESANGVSFNVCSFLFGFLWLGYRKMYKMILLLAVVFLVIDLILFLIGYEYTFSNNATYIDTGIMFAVIILYGFYGNKFYKNFVEKQVDKIKQTNGDTEKINEEIERKGGVHWFGPIIGLLILLGVYTVPSMFIPVHVNDVDQVKLSTFTEFPDVLIGDLFDEVFQNGEWKEVDEASISEHSMVDFVATYNEGGQIHDVTIRFGVHEEEEEELGVFMITINGEELNDLETVEYLQFIFRNYNQRE